MRSEEEEELQPSCEVRRKEAITAAETVLFFVENEYDFYVDLYIFVCS
jgi:hypothetical protein